ncbi:unnamed protein product [Linum tenue]|uniref:Uncharacterized protein n=1 Tax=Linum tenue TaxID=586396 RepID=A0AAV0R604_9ROSI|nr:unnamed protein product [Linum tenue]
MRDRGKALDPTNNKNGELFLHDDDDSASYLPCKRHPSPSSSSPPVGICPHCLKERLLTLLCSDCGEQRLSSCSCSQISPNRASNSSNSNLEVGSVSFLIENNAQFQPSNSLNRSNSNKPPQPPAEVLILKRSSSSCVEIKRRRGGLWKIGRFFTRRSKEKLGSRSSGNRIPHSVAGIEDRGMVSRSRSLCSFRGGGFFAGSEDGTYSGARSSVSGARSSLSAARSSGFNGLVFDPDRKSGYSESEPRKSGFDVENQKRDCSIPRVSSLREGNFTTAVDDSGFIDLKFDFPSSESRPPAAEEATEYGMAGGDRNGGSFRMTVGDRGIKRSRKSFKSWRWIFRPHHHHHQHNPSSCNHDYNNHHHLGAKGEQRNNAVNPM